VLAARRNSAAAVRIDGAGEPRMEASSVEEGGPVKIQRSLTRERLVRQMEVRRANECVSRAVKRPSMCLRESVAKVSSWNPGGVSKSNSDFFYFQI
jgi:hypothetical protein